MDLNDESSEYFDEEEMIKPAKQPRMSGSELYKPPTVEELNSLRETQNLFHSNLIRLQISELLKEVTLAAKKRTKIDEFLHSLHDALMSIDKTDKFQISDFVKFFDNIKIPFIMKPPSKKGNMICGPPADIQVVGSYLLHTILKHNTTIDLAVEMPTDSLQAKDHLNQRYLRKRAIYLTYIAQQLKVHDLISKVKFSYFEDNPLHPVLLLTPSGKLAKSVTVRVLVYPGNLHVKAERFHPSKSNVRQSWFTGISQNTESVPPLPTPQCNSLVLRDLLLVDQLKYLYDVLSDAENFRGGIKLLKVWSRQRELDKGLGALNGFLISMLVAYLLRRKKLNTSMSSYQVVRNVFQYLGSSNWTQSGASFDGEGVADFHKYYEVVFLDPSGKLNLCANMSSAIYKHVCHEATLSLQTLDNKAIGNGFNSVFMTPLPFVRQFDHILHISKPWVLKATCEKANLVGSIPDHGGNPINIGLPHLLGVLREGLGSRIKLIGLRNCTYGEWDIDSPPPLWKTPITPLSLGLLLDADHACGVVDKGPQADSPEATAFREFWGDKSDLRRFQDGSIREAVVWECKNKFEQRRVFERICHHLLSLHCKIGAGGVKYVSSQVEQILTLDIDPKQKEYVPVPGYSGTGDEINLRLIHSFNELCTQLRGLKDLPLTISSMQGVSPALRFTEVYPPVQNFINQDQVMKKMMKKIQVPDSETSAPPFVHAVEVICHLEGSGKWPQDVEALRRLKAAFHITFAEELEKSCNTLTCVPTQTFLDIYKDGFVFRIFLAYHREVTIMQTNTTKDGMVRVRSTSQSLALEERTVHLPKIASALHGLNQKNSCFGLTSRLAKRWINGQLLSGHIPEIVVELLCAGLFTNPEPFAQPSSSQAGFVRFLWFLATFDFQDDPVIINISGDMTESDVSLIHQHFKANRPALPPLFIATNYDKIKSLWTSRRPIPMILQRIKALAEISLKNIERRICDPRGKLDYKDIFYGSLAAYDVIIHLESSCVARKFETCQQGNISLEDVTPPDEQARILPVVNFDPVRLYLDELEDCFSSVAMFFHDQNGGVAIGVLWRPDAFKLREFKISNMSCVSLAQGKLAPDVNSILDDFKILGRGLVTSIELRSDKWKI